MQFIQFFAPNESQSHLYGRQFRRATQGSPLFTLRAANPIPRPLPPRAREGELCAAGRKVFCVGGGFTARVSTMHAELN